MADTPNRDKISGEEYLSVNLRYGIPNGTAMSIQNQSPNIMKVSISATKPDNDSEAFILLAGFPFPPIDIPAGTNAVWVQGNGYINVQEL